MSMLPRSETQSLQWNPNPQTHPPQSKSAKSDINQGGAELQSHWFPFSEECIQALPQLFHVPSLQKMLLSIVPTLFQPGKAIYGSGACLIIWKYLFMFGCVNQNCIVLGSVLAISVPIFEELQR